MIEHLCWRPHGYDQGIGGMRIGICGYSHYTDDEDHDGLTRDILGDVISGVASYRFFTAIASAFGYKDVGDFWGRVLFFNFLPSAVGDSSLKFAAASEDENERARARVARILDEHEPDKVFVFSEKAWAAFPKTDEELSGAAAPPGEARDGTYKTSRGHRVEAFGIRHPQGASAALLREAVSIAMMRTNLK